MRHRKKFNHLGRKSSHRKAMLSNMASSLILHKRIKTTVAKAKALRMYVEPLITKSKDDSTHSRRVVFSYLKDKFAVTELFREVSVKIGSRPGGYTRILKTGNRLGDNADMCIIELVDYNENMLAEKEEAKAKTTRRSRRGKKKADTTVSAEVKEQVEQKEEIVETTEDKVDDKVSDIAGQKAITTLSKKDISNFKLRKKMPIGVKVTLRKNRMYEFLERLISVSIPRVRDFRGISDKFDGKGNYTLGIQEQLIFPEINIDQVNQILGMNITFVTSANTDEEGYALLKEFGLPFKNINKK